MPKVIVNVIVITSSQKGSTAAVTNNSTKHSIRYYYVECVH